MEHFGTFTNFPETLPPKQNAIAASLLGCATTGTRVQVRSTSGQVVLWLDRETRELEAESVRLRFDELQRVEIRLVGDRMLFLTLEAASRTLVFYQFLAADSDLQMSDLVRIPATCELPFQHNLRPEWLAARGSLISAADQARALNCNFSGSNRTAGRITVPVYSRESLIFDLEEGCVSGPEMGVLPFDQVTRCDVDWATTEGDVKTHYRYYLLLASATGSWVFTERAKEYHNDMSASNDDRGKIRHRISAIPLVCQLPFRSSVPPPENVESVWRNVPEDFARRPGGQSQPSSAWGWAGGMVAALVSLILWNRRRAS